MVTHPARFGSNAPLCAAPHLLPGAGRAMACVQCALKGLSQVPQHENKTKGKRGGRGRGQGTSRDRTGFRMVALEPGHLIVALSPSRMDRGPSRPPAWTAVPLALPHGPRSLSPSRMDPGPVSCDRQRPSALSLPLSRAPVEVLVRMRVYKVELRVLCRGGRRRRCWPGCSTCQLDPPSVEEVRVGKVELALRNGVPDAGPGEEPDRSGALCQSGGASPSAQVLACAR